MAAFFLGLRALAFAALAGSAGAQAQQAPSADDAAWAAARELGTADACQRYLETFPAGRHAQEAFQCLVEGSLGIVPEAAPDPAQNLDVY
jgi:hypothetical protein